MEVDLGIEVMNLENTSTNDVLANTKLDIEKQVDRSVGIAASASELVKNISTDCLSTKANNTEDLPIDAGEIPNRTPLHSSDRSAVNQESPQMDVDPADALEENRKIPETISEKGQNKNSQSDEEPLKDVPGVSTVTGPEKAEDTTESDVPKMRSITESENKEKSSVIGDKAEQLPNTKTVGDMENSSQMEIAEEAGWQRPEYVRMKEESEHSEEANKNKNNMAPAEDGEDLGRSTTKQEPHSLYYRKGDDGYDSDTSESVSSDDSSIHFSSEDLSDQEQTQNITESQPEDPLPKKKTKRNRKDVFEVDIRTKGELTLNDLPPLEELKIDVDPKVVLTEVGTVQNLLGPIVIIQANKLLPALDQDTILFNEGRTPVGQIFETFGPVPQPLYIIRFNTPKDIKHSGVQVGNKVFYAATMKEYTRLVFVEQLKQVHGSDASWEHNNEPPEKYLDYSDDEEERKARHRIQNKDKGDGEQEEEGEPSSTAKKKRKRKPRLKKDSVEAGSSHNRFHPKSHGSWPPTEPSSKWEQTPPLGIPQWPPPPPPGGVYRQQLPCPPSRMSRNAFRSGPPSRHWGPMLPDNFDNGPPGSFSGGPPGNSRNGPPGNSCILPPRPGRFSGHNFGSGWSGLDHPSGRMPPPHAGNFVQYMDRQNMSVGQGMRPPPPNWQSPRPPVFRPPVEFGGAPSFACGPPGWNG